MSELPPAQDGKLLQAAGALPKASARLNWIIGSATVLVVAGMFALAFLAPKLGGHLYALLLCVVFPSSAISSFMSALTFFRRGAIFMGILLMLSAIVLLLSTIFPLMALFP